MALALCSCIGKTGTQENTGVAAVNDSVATNNVAAGNGEDDGESHWLPEQFKTKAQAMSGGQQQRIAIARMFLKNPPIIFLDEPTASLDAIATEQIKSSIDAIKKNRTVVIISHNISQIIDSDVIYALKNGRVEQGGNPDEVYRQGGIYKEIVDASARSMNIGKLAQTLDTDGDGKIDI